MQNYYKDTWTKKGKNGAEFFKNVDFSHRTYQFQEHVFRQHLLSYRNFINMGAYKPVESVLELGAGTGRMTKIMLEIFPDILNYDVTDLMFDRLTLAETIGSQNMRKLNWYSLDITSDEFNLVFAPHSPTKTYDFILASEVFMHIKPEDIGSVIEKCCKLLVRTSGTATITNIDWSTDPCLLYTSPSPRDGLLSRMPSSA